MNQRLATVERLKIIGTQVTPKCAFCNQTEETFDHLYFEFPYSMLLSGTLVKWLGFQRNILPWKQELDWIGKLARRKNGLAEITTFAMTVYCIWRDRNKLRFQKEHPTIERTCKEIILHIHVQERSKARWQDILRALNHFPS